jgi:hypothetical protein
MKKSLVIVLFVTVLGQLSAQKIVNEHPINQSFWVPEQTGAYFFIPDSSYFSLEKGHFEIESSSFNKFSLFSIVNTTAERFGANGFFQDSLVFDSISGMWRLRIRLFALNRFDVDKLPVVPPGLYLLNPNFTSGGKVRVGQAALESDLPGTSSLDIAFRNFVIPPDTFFYIAGQPNLMVFLDGPMGAKYKWKKRKLESDFVFSVRGSADSFSYKTNYSKKNSIYVSLRPALAHWFLAGYGFDWWNEGKF